MSTSPQDPNRSRLPFRIEEQPDLTSCGPTCLHAVYRYYADERPLDQVIDEVLQLEEGGTLGVMLGLHALDAGYRVTVYTYNLTVFDPTWFADDSVDLSAKLAEQAEAKPVPKLRTATDAYRAFLGKGGRLRMVDLTAALIRKYLKRKIPIVAGLSSTYLYQSKRERVDTFEEDDILGESTGHFVVLCGYDATTRRVLIADPFLPNPLSETAHPYEVSIERAVCAVLLGIVTYDANLVVIEPAGRRRGDAAAQ